MAILNINAELFEHYKHAEDKPVLVDFWAPWCVYCRRIGPAFDKLAQQYESELVFAKINIDEENALAAAEQIEVIPTLVLYKGGQALGSITAPESKAQIEEFILQHIGKAGG